ncbi:hypothetical protein LCGC14_1184530 [marine sediment metagenome]|uniref:Uncharacterized protein n=1 Tax=marine sediment metagenome TaxID=412755 RepID=A0A0F9PRP8_9ZZZZ
MNSITEIAEIAHEANRIYCRSLGDYSQLPWDFCEQWQRDTVLNGVRAIKNGLVKEPSQSHENWLKCKEGEGWVYGEKKNINKMFGRLTHPCMVPFDKLPLEQQMKDHLFFVIVTTLLGW